MKIFVFDTETTGFPQKGEDLTKQPHVVQVAGVLVDIDPATGTMTELERLDEKCKPPVSIPFGASQVHGIYDKDVADKPPFEAVADRLLKIANGADAVSGHNVSFDEEILSFELKRLGRDGWWHPRQVICTMRTSTEYCKLEGRGFSWKPPKLNELHKKLFGAFFDGAHNAIFDVESTAKCLAELVRLKVIQLEEPKELRLF